MSFHKAYPLTPKGSKDNGTTPRYFYEELDQEFHFNFDPCPSNPAFDGLSADWGTRTFVNPPFSKKVPWIKKAIEQAEKGNLVVMLLPVDTSTRWFHDLILPNAEIRWIRGRLKGDRGKPYMWATMLAIFRPRVDLAEFLAKDALAAVAFSWIKRKHMFG